MRRIELNKFSVFSAMWEWIPQWKLLLKQIAAQKKASVFHTHQHTKNQIMFDHWISSRDEIWVNAQTTAY